MIEKTKARKKARSYLIENIGNMVGPGEPILNKKENTWEIPIIYQSYSKEIKIGKLILDKEGGVESVPSKNELLKNLEKAKSIYITLEVKTEHPKELISSLEKITKSSKIRKK